MLTSAALFRTALVVIDGDTFTATFKDARENRFCLTAMEGDEEYRRIAECAGCGDDWRRYGAEHELNHHWLADGLARNGTGRCTRACTSHRLTHIAWEEHIMNMLQRLSRAGESDEHGVLPGLFPDLNSVASNLPARIEDILS